MTYHQYPIDPSELEVGGRVKWEFFPVDEEGKLWAPRTLKECQRLIENGLDGEDWPAKVDLIPALADALETQLAMWEELGRYVKPRMGACDMETTMTVAVDKRFSERMDAIELQFLPGTPDDPAEIDRRLKELRGDVDE